MLYHAYTPVPQPGMAIAQPMAHSIEEVGLSNDRIQGDAKLGLGHDPHATL